MIVCTICLVAKDTAGFYSQKDRRCKECICAALRAKRAAQPPRPPRESEVTGVVFGSDTERAWAAGFFDGEGSVSVASSRGRRGTLSARNINADCNQIDPEVLERFQAAVGVGTVRGPYAKIGGRPRWDYRAGGIERVELLYEALWPYLGSVKKEQAVRKIAEYRAWREEWERLLPPGNRRISLGPPRKALLY